MRTGDESIKKDPHDIAFLLDAIQVEPKAHKLLCSTTIGDSYV